MMPSQKLVFLPDPDIAKSCYVSSPSQYKQMYQKSIENPSEFWGEIADNFYWKRPIDFDNFNRFNFDVRKGPVFTKWLDGATTNISYNLLDRNIRNGNGKKIAFYWEGNDPKNSKCITYSELLSEVCRFANVLKSRNIQKGDRVAIYMPMILEAVVTMLACTRIGAVHSLVFAGFSADSFAERITDCQARLLVTADATWRGQKLIKLKSICDESMEICKKKGHMVDTCIVVAHLQKSELPDGVPKCFYEAPMLNCRDFWWHEVVPSASANCPPEWMEAEDPLFILYTSGSTGKPKGVLHTTGGYLLYAATTFKFVFDYKPGDIYWCTADIGWITGHTYVVYGPLANAATSVMYEGTPFYPTNSRYWEIVEKYKVNQFYTAPTAIRTLMKFGEDIIKKHNLTTLRVLGSVGEPINPEAWLWYYKNIGREKCSIVDTYWQTETGGHIITPLPGVTAMKPGAASSPFFGVQPILLDDNGKEIEGEGEGYLVFSRPWPGIMRTLFNNHDRYEETYFKRFPGYYFSGDGARRDSDGYIWVTGRVDDMLNVSGHLMSTAEVESVLTEHKCVTEAAVVAKPHPIKGECLYCFITIAENAVFDDKLQTELKQLVRERIGPFAQPDVIHNAPGLPKTRSGKIMRRILRKIAQDDHDIGDISTLADSGIVDVLFKTKPISAKAQS